MAWRRYPLGDAHAKAVRLSRWFHLLFCLFWLVVLANAVITGEGAVARPALLAFALLTLVASAQRVTRRDRKARAEAAAQDPSPEEEQARRPQQPPADDP